MREIGEMENSPNDQLTGEVIGAIIRVHTELGPGFLESVYRRALMVELELRGIPYAAEREVFIAYQGREVGKHRLDLVVGDRLILELKCVEALIKAHYSQVRSYLKATGLPVALLVNLSKPLAEYRRVELT
jgi:GxxExxY protein